MAERKHAPVHSGVLGKQYGESKIKLATQNTLEGVPSIKLGYVFSTKDDFGKPTKIDVIKEYIDDGNLDLENIKEYFAVHLTKFKTVCRNAGLTKRDCNVDFVLEPVMQASNDAIKLNKQNIMGLMQAHVKDVYNALNGNVIYPLKATNKDVKTAYFSPKHNFLLEEHIEEKDFEI